MEEFGVLLSLSDCILLDEDEECLPHPLNMCPLPWLMCRHDHNTAHTFNTHAHTHTHF